MKSTRYLILSSVLLALAFAPAAHATTDPPTKVHPPVYTDLLPLTPWTDARLLGINTAETYTVPSACHLLILGADAIFYLRSGGTATIPSGDVTDGTASAISPAALLVKPGDELSMISPAATHVTLRCYDLSGD